MRSTSGETMRHGPHQVAQKSTSTGTEAVISSPKPAAVASTIHGRSVWQTLHRGTPEGTGRTRFLAPQFGQETIVPGIAITQVDRSRDRACKC
ncbi:MAG: hypothetical protein QOD66_1319 [Solirubrobacteraceae bacterium]|nr:hypothetical protein [Solirubrobacteraceae bacterium]